MHSLTGLVHSYGKGVNNYGIVLMNICEVTGTLSADSEKRMDAICTEQMKPIRQVRKSTYAWRNKSNRSHDFISLSWKQREKCDSSSSTTSIEKFSNSPEYQR
jgi:hypothetical protein